MKRITMLCSLIAVLSMMLYAQTSSPQKAKPVRPVTAVSTVRSGDICTSFKGFMGLSEGMAQLKKIQTRDGVRFQSNSREVTTFPSALAIMVLVSQHSCDAHYTPNTATDSELLKKYPS
jgi:hypothetical protein